jgi:tetratricopeptide (TPR) repeat protein
MRTHLSLNTTSRTVLPLGVLVLLLLGTAAHGQSVERLIASGDSLLRLEKPQRALEYYEKAVAAGPSAPALLGRAKAFYMTDRMDRFLVDVENALRLDSTLGEAHYQRALYAMRANEATKAERHGTLAIRYAADSTLKARSFILRGEARADLKRYPEAIEDIDHGIKSGQFDSEAMRTLGRLLDQSGRHQEALVVLERLCELDPYDVGNWSNRGFELIMLERYDEAMVMIEKALALDKDEPVALSNRAFVNLKLGREQEAWSDIERSLRSYPSNPHALRTRALLRLRKGERSKACEDLTLAKALGDVAEVDALIKEHCATTRSNKRR